MKKKIIPLIIAISITLYATGCGRVSVENNAKEKIDISATNENDSSEAPKENTTLKTQGQVSKPETQSNKEDSNSKNNKENQKSSENINKISSENKSSNNTSINTSNKEISWYYVPRTDGVPPRCVESATNILNKYDTYYLGNTSNKTIYLTFDEGYENGYSSKILDILKENKVKAAFFVTTPYIESNKELIKRMVDEGHLVCNHSTHHPSMASINDLSKFNGEFSVCEKAYKEVIGKDMPKFFRPPMGKFSETSLKRTKDLGYKTIFWSFAYGDWQTDKQPTQDKAKKTIMERLHPGAIYLLHAVSKTNTEVLDEVIKNIKSQGYSFKTLNDLPNY
ncbi:delta-lactam-biosynthetic de-N-acetylase [Haloimpatiens sp. FM7315]|uniref:delta-lactam-biosynthetic de-N-acetylase n=1 Tax=Haloimpatiens sp. FM7315 TaxID=3298609 RepID=UPI0035A26EA1